MTSVGPVRKQQETSSRYCVANDNLGNVCRYCRLLMLQQPCGSSWVHSEEYIGKL
jgi:hypothetical protein